MHRVIFLKSGDRVLFVLYQAKECENALFNVGEFVDPIDLCSGGGGGCCCDEKQHWKTPKFDCENKVISESRASSIPWKIGNRLA